MFRIFTSILICSFVYQGWAQTSSATIGGITPESAASVTTPTSSSDILKEKKDVERVQVTGSHIKRIDVEGPSPVQTINRSDLEKTGYNAVSDVLRETSMNSFGSTREESGSNASGVAHVDLRGLGSGNTLVLLNGQRLPTDAITGAVDLNLIPMAAVERIEVLKDGASAIYGSDALGGVVNIITRQDFSGSEVSFEQSSPELKGGGKKNISLVNGINRGRLNMVNVVQYRNNDAVYSRDRSWTNDGYSTIGGPGSYTDDSGVWHADPSCPGGMVVQTPQGNFCKFRHSDYSTQLPELEQVSLFSETNYNVNSRVKVKARLGGTQKKGEYFMAPAPGTFTIPAAVAATLGPGGGPLPGVDPTQDLRVRYRLVDLGPRHTQVTTYSYNALLGSTVQLGRGWELDASAAHNAIHNRDEGVNGYALTGTLTNNIATGQCNIFDGSGSPGCFNNARYKPLEQTVSELSSVDVKASGEIGNLPSGPIGLAVGTSTTAARYEDKFDERSVNNEVFGNAGSTGKGSRQTIAGYSEVSVPLSKKVELQIAGRFDHYSDFGSTTNPKAAIVYRATKSLMVRGSVGTGFKAPQMQEMYAGKSLGYPSMIDARKCAEEQQGGGATPSCNMQQIEVTSGGNPGLKEERSISYNAGIVYEPIPEFNIGTDFFFTKLNNVVGLDYNEAMKYEAKHGVGSLGAFGIKVKRDNNGYIENIEAPLQNLSAQEITGMDFNTGLRIGKVKFSVDHSQLFYFKEQGFPGSPSRNVLGDSEKPAWRNTVGVMYNPGERHAISLSALTTAGQRKEQQELGSLADYTTFNLQYVYKRKKFGTITAGVSNLLGTRPPLDESDPSRRMNSSLYDQIGRTLFTAYKAQF